MSPCLLLFLIPESLLMINLLFSSSTNIYPSHIYIISLRIKIGILDNFCECLFYYTRLAYISPILLCNNSLSTRFMSYKTCLFNQLKAYVSGVLC